MDNGLSTYSQFFEVVNRVENFVPTAKSIFVKATSCLDFAISHCDMQEEKLKKVNFLLRQIQLLYSTNYNTSDYRFALEFFHGARMIIYVSFLHFLVRERCR